MNDLIAVTAGWGVIALGVVGVYLFGRDPKADEHDLSDYHEPDPELDALKQRIIAGLKHGRPTVLAPAMTVTERDILPPAPPGMDAGSPLYAGMLFDTWHPESPSEVAARVLREMGVEARAKAGIRPAYATAHRDMTGSFPVVRAAA